MGYNRLHSEAGKFNAILLQFTCGLLGIAIAIGYLEYLKRTTDCLPKDVSAIQSPVTGVRAHDIQDGEDKKSYRSTRDIQVKRYICGGKDYYILASNSQHGLIKLATGESYFGKAMRTADKDNNEVILGSEVNSLVKLIGTYAFNTKR